MLLLASISVFGISNNAHATYQQINYGGVIYQVDDNGYPYATPLSYDGISSAVVIPKTISAYGYDYTVSARDFNEIFVNQSSIQSVTVENEEFDCPFDGCTNLVTVSLPESMTELNISFKNCPKLDLASVLIGIQSIGRGDFSLSEPTDCGIFNDVILPECNKEQFVNRQYSISVCNHSQFNILDMRGTRDLTVGNQDFQDALTDCSNLTTLTFNDCKDINSYYLFSGTRPTSLESVTFSNCDGVTFSEFSSVKTIYLKGLINSADFTDLPALTDLDFQGLTHLGNLSVSKTSIVNLNLNNCVDNIMLSGDELSTVTGCDNVKEAYITGTKIKSLSFPNIEQIRNGAFAYNSELVELYLGKTLRTLGIDETLYGCPKFQDFVYGGSIEEWLRIDIENFDETSPGYAFLAKVPYFYYGHNNMKHTKLTELNASIVGGADQIPYGAFTGYKGLTKISLPASVKKIGAYAFENCTNLSNVDIRTEHIDQWAFYLCNSIESITLGNQLNYIGPAFHTSYKKPLTVNYLGETSEWMKVTRSMIFYNDVKDSENTDGGYSNRCTCNLQSIADEFLFNSKILENLVLNEDDTITDALRGIKTLKSLVFNYGYSAPSIPNNAFYGCTGLMSVKYNSKNKSQRASVNNHSNGFAIGDQAFANCFNLSDIEILDNIKSIGSDALYGTAWFKKQPHQQVLYFDTEDGKTAYTYLGVAPEGTHIEIEDGTYVINRDFLYFSSELSSEPRNFIGVKSISLPGTLKIIGANAFSNASIEGDFIIPASVKIYDDSHYYGEIETLTIEDSSENLYSSDSEYSGLSWLQSSSLKKVYFGRNLSNTGFRTNGLNESGLQSVIYGPMVTDVNDNNDLNCHVNQLYTLAKIPPHAVSSEIFDWNTWTYVNVYNAFRSIDYNTCTLHVPAGTLNAYRDADGWREFANIIDDAESSVSGVENILAPEQNNAQTRPRHYNVLGHEINEATPGLHIIVNPDGTTEKVIKH